MIRVAAAAPGAAVVAGAVIVAVAAVVVVEADAIDPIEQRTHLASIVCRRDATGPNSRISCVGSARSLMSTHTIGWDVGEASVALPRAKS